MTVSTDKATPADGAAVRPIDLADETIALVQRWLKESTEFPVDAAGQRLAGVLKDPNGLDFTVGFVDGVARPEDLFVAGYALQGLTDKTPKFLPWYMRSAIKVGGVLGPVIPWIVVPAARFVLRQMVGHLVVDATPQKLGPAIAKLREDGARLNLNLLGEAVLGEKEANRRLEGTRKLLARDDVDYVSIKVSSIVSQISMWSFEDTLERVVEKLTPLYELAASSGTGASGNSKFINLDMEEFHDLDLTIEVFERILDKPELLNLEAGIVLQAYLPNALGALQRITAWSKARRARGGAPVKVRVVKGANLPMEQVDASLHGWPQATYTRKQDSDTNYKRVLNWAFTPENIDAVRIGVAGHNLFDVAFSHLLALKRGVTDGVEYEMLLGMATGQAAAVKRDVGQLLLYTPVVNPSEFDVAISYLIRRLEENASQDNFMSAVFELADTPALFEREKNRFLASLTELDRWEQTAGADEAPASHRLQDRAAERTGGLTDGYSGFRPQAEVVDAQAPDDLTGVVIGLSRGSSPEALVHDDGFRNSAETDPSIGVNREWGIGILERSKDTQLGLETLEASRIDDAGILDRVIDTVTRSGTEWGKKTGAERAEVIDRAGIALEANRARLLEIMAFETGKTLAEGDPEVSEAVDFAHYYAARARELDAVQGATFQPSKLTVVTPPWNFPVAIPAGGVLAALAAGSGVIIKPASLAKRSAAVMVEALWEAGIPRELLAYVDLADRSLGQRLVAHDGVDRVILTGGWETAQLFKSWRPDLPVLAETSGKNAIIVTPSADLDLAAADVVKSAFGHAGQKCSAASLVILVGSVNKSARFRNQLIDAATTLQVGYPQDPTTQMGPIIEPAKDKLLHALTTLGAGEDWVVKPRKLDDSGRLWSPGIRDHVQPGSYFHLTEFFGPVLGIMHAKDLSEAIRFQNAIDYGLTAGLHSLDSEELGEWLDTIQSGNLYVNRGITGAIVQRQPFGGWKRSAVGAGTKAGGPNYLVGLGSWVADNSTHSNTLHLRGIDPLVTQIIEASQSSLEFDQFETLRRAALSDTVAWASEFGAVKDASNLHGERNLLRYRRMPVTVRLNEAGAMHDLLRVIIAGCLSRSEFSVSTAVALPAGVQQVLDQREIPVTVQTDTAWLSRATSAGLTGRVRLIGGGATELAAATGGNPDVAIYAGDVTPAGRIELLPFLHEQAISITAHRFGNPSTLSDGVI
ncbi:bifunctional proline dehydrogenase/L-glutamate gamma-semialdehyde dehydrogenase [Homoserinimonas sp. OAct 916]|uniref:proline dehydrogenase family protein n=1 Tax=Homoserinimonas sp. OAct 916 TaxID=2211450 RepID=UPI000DBE7458|nr:bifunctional proline dehydrogenase/L-glutamate gamma-semialdehyde dehydrogenase [Homoserinimonas sp. OAct 916]